MKTKLKLCGRYSFSPSLFSLSLIIHSLQPIQAQLRNGVFIYTRIRTSIPHSAKSLKYDLNESSDHRLPNVVLEEHIIDTSSDEVFLHLSSHKNYSVYIDQGTSVGFNDSIELKPIMIYSRKIGCHRYFVRLFGQNYSF